MSPELLEIAALLFAGLTANLIAYALTARKPQPEPPAAVIPLHARHRR